MEYHAIMKGNEMQVYAKTWANLADIMLKGNTQTQKEYISNDSIYRKLKIGKNSG